jgi:DedD protein
LDIHLKQRLTGAVILVLIAVLLVPELLTGPDSPPAPDVAEPGISDASGMRSYEIDISDAPPPTAAPLPPSARVAAPAPVVESAPPPAPSLPPPSASPPVPVTRAAPVARSPAPAPATEGRLVVQVGSFSSRPAADKLASDLRRRSFPAAVSSVKASGRTMYRVRVGPVADRAAANELAGKLRAAGHAGTVVPVS